MVVGHDLMLGGSQGIGVCSSMIRYHSRRWFYEIYMYVLFKGVILISVVYTLYPAHWLPQLPRPVTFITRWLGDD